MAADETWRPLSVRESGRTAEYDGPFDGVPEWLFDPLYGWIKAIMPAQGPGHLRGAAIGEYQRLAMRLRLSLKSSNPPSHAIPYETQFYKLALSNPTILLDAADAVLQDLNPNSQTDVVLLMSDRESETDRKRIEALGEILRLAGSVYRVQPMLRRKPAHLVRRVAPQTESALARELRRTDPSADHLHEAWKATFGRSPKPSEGYAQAIKAIESAAIPVICPKNQSATLGTIIRDIRSAPQKWRLVLSHADAVRQMTALADWLDVIWKGQHDRHGKAEVARDVTQKEAETAVTQVVAIVALFRDGAVEPVTTT